MESVIIIVHVLAAIGITGLVLLQHGKGADMGASFGSGASQTLFGSSGSGNALTKSTSWLAIVFFATSLALAMIARQKASQGIEDSSLIQNLDQVQQQQQQADDDLPQAPAAAAEADSDLPQLPATQDDAAESVSGLEETTTDDAAEAPVEDATEQQ